jgi:hypothetical protein
VILLVHIPTAMGGNLVIYCHMDLEIQQNVSFLLGSLQVPDPWKRYVEEVDEEQEMWLNSFIKSPFRIPMPPELEYQWAKGMTN